MKSSCFILSLALLGSTMFSPSMAGDFSGYFSMGAQTQLQFIETKPSGALKKTDKTRLAYLLPIEFFFMDLNKKNPLGHVAAVSYAMQLGYCPEGSELGGFLINLRMDFPWTFYHSKNLVLATGLGGGMDLDQKSVVYGLWTSRAILSAVGSTLQISYDYDPFGGGHRFDTLLQPFKAIPLGLQGFYALRDLADDTGHTIGASLLWYSGN